MTEDELTRLEALCQAAPEDMTEVCGVFNDSVEIVYDEAREFYYTSRTALPALLAEVRRLKTVEQAYIKIVPFLAVHGLLDYTGGPDTPTLTCGACGVLTNTRYNGMCFACAARSAE